MKRPRRRPFRPRKRSGNQAPPPPLKRLLSPRLKQQALLTPVVASAFGELGIGVSLWIGEDQWYPIHSELGVMHFEFDFGVIPRRWVYNERAFQRVLSERKMHASEHAGFWDLFVPVLHGSEVLGVFVAGPFARQRPSSGDVLERWYEISGTQGRLGDASFLEYVSRTLATVTFDDTQFKLFERLMECFVTLVIEGPQPEAVAAEIDTLRKKLTSSRLVERMWAAASTLADERSFRGWGTHAHGTMVALSLEEIPQHALVGLGFGFARERDAVHDHLQRAAFQRACAELSLKLGGMVAGRIAHQGVFFLLDHRGPGARGKLGDIAGQAAAVARRFGFKLHWGIAEATKGSTLPARYQAALWAAEKALSTEKTFVYAGPRPLRPSSRLHEHRVELAKSLGDPAGMLSARFERYVQAVLSHAGYRLETVRVHLEVGLEELVAPLQNGGWIEPKSLEDLWSAVGKSAADSGTVAELAGHYRRFV
ncbi:MAG TPA: hypothetical protein VGP93_07025, partial [Polyangiaceae bacterium]|nr:hypothetical protein [Polyangiaceae bacterium]